MDAKCETCGKETNVPCKTCGTCAADWNRPGGRKAINARRKANGLSPLSHE